jgi:hypothetical protein
MLYNIYTTDGYVPLGITDWEHLRVMRLDYTERQLFNHRYVKDEPSHNSLFKARDINSKLQNVGFISRDFHEKRPSGQLAIRFFKILATYKEKLNIFFYTRSNAPVNPIFNELGKLRMSAEDDAIAQQIVDDKIDILIDMQGFMVDNYTNVLLKKPAPIQIHWLGYPGTLGLPTIDYLVADDILIPDQSQKYYREKIAYLPHCYQSNNPEFIQKEQYVKRGYFNLPEDAFIFTHFNSDYKLDRKTWFVWMSILKKVPKSILVFTVLTSTENDLFMKQLKNDAKTLGVEENRVIYLRREERHQHFNRLQIFNLGLDTYRVNGHTTNADLVCAGIPFITYTSDTYHNRVAKSILHSLDLDDLVCNSFDEYTNKAVELATNPEYYQSVKAKVVENRSKIMFNTYLYTRSFVNLLYSMWDQYHYDGEERKEIEHIFEENHERKIVPFESCRLSKFNNHYYGSPKSKWVFYPNKCVCDSIEVSNTSELRKQYLRDYANLQKECVGFNTEGQLFNSLTHDDLVDMESVDTASVEMKYGEEQGVWMREDIPKEELELDVYDTLNKDYKLPKICIYFVLEPGMNPQLIPSVSTYLYSQVYLNAELIFISRMGPIDVNGQKFISENINFIKFYVDKGNKSIQTILAENTTAKISLEIKPEHLNDLFYVQKFYDAM